jgi:predicted PurR-regulated permease PerM
VRQNPLLTPVLGLALVIGTGWLLVAGRGILIPIVMAVLSVYVLSSAAEWLARVPPLSRLPMGLLRAVCLLLFAVLIYFLSVVVGATVQEIVDRAPEYQQNIAALLRGLEDRLGLPPNSIFDQAVNATVGAIDAREFALAILGGATSAGASAFMVLIYAGFLFAEQARFREKISAALPDPDRAEAAMDTVTDINDRIGEYLAVKTLVNVILGSGCLAVMLALDTDFALFWAIVIGLANYVPYVGSYVGVAGPVLLSIAQTGSIAYTLLLAALLTAMQVLVGNLIEPKLLGRQLNLSPFVVIVSLALWSSLWGVAGALLAVPLTSVVAIVLARFDTTRPLSYLLAERVDLATRENAREP